MAGNIDLSNFHAVSDFVSITISSTVDLNTNFSGYRKLLVTADGGAARYSLSTKDPGTTGHILAQGDSIIISAQSSVKFKGTTLVVTPGR
jgi:hypothetical protein